MFQKAQIGPNQFIGRRIQRKNLTTITSGRLEIELDKHDAILIIADM